MTDDDRTAREGAISPPDPETGAAAPETAEDAPRAGGGEDAGSPGGMGGVRGGVANPDHRPNGGVSPIRNDGQD